VVEFQNGEINIGERIPGGYIFVDGAGVGDVNSHVMREREALAREGIVLVNLLLDKSTGRLREEPEVLTRGFVLRDSDELLSEARRRISDAVSRGNGNLQEDLQQLLKTFIYNETKRRPTIFVTMSKS
jgi:ribonuclease J